MTILAWPVGGLLAAGAAWIVGKTALGLRSDYLAIATLGISEIVIAVIKNEDWMARGVKNVIGIPARFPTKSTYNKVQTSLPAQTVWVWMLRRLRRLPSSCHTRPSSPSYWLS